MESLRPWSARITFYGDSRVLVKKLDKGYYGKAIGRGAAGFPRLKSAEPDREPAPAQHLGGLGLADIVLCAPGFKAERDRLKLFRHGQRS
jgi:hypothetical protein